MDLHPIGHLFEHLLSSGSRVVDLGRSLNTVTVLHGTAGRTDVWTDFLNHPPTNMEVDGMASWKTVFLYKPVGKSLP